MVAGSLGAPDAEDEGAATQVKRAIVIFLLCALCAAAQNQPRKKHVLCIGESRGYQHDTVSDGMATIWKLDQETGLWETFIRTDAQLITKKKLQANAKNLDYFDAVFFYTTGELDMDDEQKAALISFVKDDGKAFVGTHSATDTFYQWPAYGEMIGAWFNHHPWNQEVGVKVEDRNFAATRHFPPEFKVADEIYQFKDWSRDKVHVLMSIDTNTVDLTKKEVLRTDKDFAVAWTKTYGRGRVFYCSLGHRPEVWARDDIKKMWTEAIKWAIGGTGTQR
jgi:type 1 glutamine amidotransferase